MAYKNKIIRNPAIGQDIRFIATGKDTNGQLLEMEATYNTRSPEQPPLHYHPYQEEDFIVLEGEIMVNIAGKTSRLQKGDTLHIDKKVVHAMWNATDQKAVMRWTVQPAMNTEYLFETTAGLAADGKTSKGAPKLLQLAVTISHFSDVFRLAKPSFAIQKILFTLLGSIGRIAGYRPTYTKYYN